MEILDEEKSVEKQEYADFSQRFIAWVIDMILVSVAAETILWAFGLGFRISGDLGWFQMVIYLVYCMVLEAGAQQGTIGKQIMRIKVTDMYGQRIEINRSMIRSLGKLLSYAIFLIGFLMALFNDKKQALHDRLAYTIVVKK